MEETIVARYFHINLTELDAEEKYLLLDSFSCNNYDSQDSLDFRLLRPFEIGKYEKEHGFNINWYVTCLTYPGSTRKINEINIQTVRKYLKYYKTLNINIMDFLNEEGF